MIIHIDSKNVERIWPAMVGGLGRALVKTSLGNFWDIPSGYEGVSSGNLLGFYMPESGYSGLYSITTTPKAKVLYLFWGGKDPHSSSTINWQELDEYLEVMATAYGCKYINMEGRKGWKAIVTPLGYQEDSHFYSREV